MNRTAAPLFHFETAARGSASTIATLPIPPNAATEIRTASVRLQLVPFWVSQSEDISY
ncbi:hypothetical protein [Bradyrhizobium sp. CCBAU 51627]|uniref:hypothetical protein n=1 Tax=Bradyrhizobium sp. CCBAU 51627 TaxID=1325088 RepID=UPI0023061813|nr:hypothetical protein [Bradyrhizobium sp. CCBAU 51627]